MVGEKLYRAIFHAPSASFLKMNSSWLASGFVCPVTLSVMVPAELVRAKAQSGAISTISAMVNLMFIFRAPAAEGCRTAALPTTDGRKGRIRTTSSVYSRRIASMSDAFSAASYADRTLVIATLSAAGVAATLAAGLASSAAALTVQPTAARSATAANMDCMWTRLTTCYSDHE